MHFGICQVNFGRFRYYTCILVLIHTRSIGLYKHIFGRNFLVCWPIWMQIFAKCFIRKTRPYWIGMVCRMFNHTGAVGTWAIIWLCTELARLLTLESLFSLRIIHKLFSHHLDILFSSFPINNTKKYHHSETENLSQVPEVQICVLKVTS